MTVEERARACVMEMRSDNSKPIQAIIERFMRDQIEDCARLVDQAHLIPLTHLAKCIRALGEPKEGKPKDWKTPILTLEEESPKPTNYYD